jgi:hypothetical protein
MSKIDNAVQGALKQTVSGSFELFCGRRYDIWRGGRITYMPCLATKQLKAV